MPLSEEELRLLEQMERALVEEDPKFASTLRGTTIRRSARRRAALSGVFFTIGVVILMTGAISATTVVGVAGFVVMLASATVGLTALRGQQAAAAHGDVPHSDDPTSGFTVIDGGRSARPRRQSRGQSRGHGKSQSRGSVNHGSFMDRMEQRWRRRKEEGGF
ncbi:DUF3040 domain-containing protein [Nocardioides sp.]|uniref:DUF3040 domain-containing protein n=1 Tax=Nocardioides sp. TaxID=35761 RepID=UPI003563BF51